jgi:hypothetical protein
MTITTTVTTLPDAPSREDPVNFPSRANAFLSALATFSSQLNSFISETNSTSSEMNDLKDQTESIYNLVLAAAGTTSKWVSGSTYTEGQLSFSPVNYQTYRRTANLPGSSTSDPSTDPTRWTQITSNTSGLLSVTGNIESGSGAGSGFATVNIGRNRLAAGGSALNFTSQIGAGADLIVSRASGASGTAQLLNSGSGNLEIANSGTGPILLSVNGNTRMRIDSSGNVLHGTGVTSGSAGIGTTRIVTSGTDFATSTAQLNRFSADNDSAYYIFSKSRGSTINTYSAVQVSDRLGRLQFWGADGTTSRVSSQISSIVAATVSSSVVPSSLTFDVTSATGVFSEAMRVHMSGSILLGHSSPLTQYADYKFGIAGVNTMTSSSYQVRFSADTAATNVVIGKSRGATVGTYTAVLANDELGRIQFAGSDGTTMRTGPEILAIAETNAASGLGNGGLRFYTRNTAGASVETIRMSQDGDSIFTIRTSAPALAVNNNMVFTLTSNTNLRISVRGSDGVTRVGNITLA